MAKVHKNITIDEELDKKLREHHIKHSSNDSRVINTALYQYFKIKPKINTKK